ncbi:zinc ribbon domain-containing protein [Halorubrum sp. AD140]|uniref:zinc ribbon domain-containing protein n=1 Tax=Halorubrum sp. AD140 TaxID=3050073 RepID=UPI002ACCA9DA|nr:zinc ribbon domain-containing protein [Halorubrum sp. AD140]MDZ5811132.1 zinc ribbon domain-containing protein [Halorubrum sp. AD140]
MPSDDNDDEAKYSVFGNDAANTPKGSGEDARVDPEAADLGDGDDGCPKCGSEETETDEIATSGTGLTKMFDVQNRAFVVVSCANCGYSELYKGQSTGNAIDFFIG